MTATHDARRQSRNPKASPMTPHTAAAAARTSRVIGLLRAAGRKLSDRAHAAGDECAHAAGWDITATPGPLGLTGRRYRDPRFNARQGRQPAAVRKDGSHD